MKSVKLRSVKHPAHSGTQQPVHRGAKPHTQPQVLPGQRTGERRSPTRHGAASGTHDHTDEQRMLSDGEGSQAQTLRPAGSVPRMFWKRQRTDLGSLGPG